MFDLETAIADWRQRMLAAGVKSPVPLDELESHLREDVEAQARGGTIQPSAFEAASLRIGQGESLKTEFAKVGGTNFAPRRVLVRAGNVTRYLEMPSIRRISASPPGRHILKRRSSRRQWSPFGSWQ